MTWEALVSSNCYKDFALEVELWNEGTLRAMIRNTPEGLEFLVFRHDSDQSIPVDWLLEKLMMAKTDIEPRSK